jgi:hypothetical protein
MFMQGILSKINWLSETQTIILPQKLVQFRHSAYLNEPASKEHFSFMYAAEKISGKNLNRHFPKAAMIPHGSQGNTAKEGKPANHQMPDPSKPGPRNLDFFPNPQSVMGFHGDLNPSRDFQEEDSKSRGSLSFSNDSISTKKI